MFTDSPFEFGPFCCLFLRKLLFVSLKSSNISSQFSLVLLQSGNGSDVLAYVCFWKNILPVFNGIQDLFLNSDGLDYHFVQGDFEWIRLWSGLSEVLKILSCMALYAAHSLVQQFEATHGSLGPFRKRALLLKLLPPRGPDAAENARKKTKEHSEDDYHGLIMARKIKRDRGQHGGKGKDGAPRTCYGSPEVRPFLQERRGNAAERQ